MLDLLARLEPADRSLCEALFSYMESLGYLPQKAQVSGYVLDFVNRDFNRKIARIGIRPGKAHTEAFSFSLRFSASDSYSEKFQDAVRKKNTSANAIKEYNDPALSCESCGVCPDDPRLYTYVYPDGQIVTSCGAYALPITGLTIDDMDEIKRLVAAQHEYFASHIELKQRASRKG